MAEFFHGPFLVLLAKSLVALIMFGSGAVCIFVLLHRKQWQEALAIIETECDNARDMSMLQATVARSQLAELREKMTHRPEKAEIEVISSIVKNAMPVLSLLMTRETSLFKWGFAGFKFIRSAYEYFSSRNKN